MDELPDVHFGPVGTKQRDWRGHPDFLHRLDNDRELPITPSDVVDMLGFDPLEDDDAA